MKIRFILIAATALMCAGCEQIVDKEAARKKIAAAEEAAALARERFENRGTTDSEGSLKTGKALTELLCSSRDLVEDIENNMYLLEALSGPGNDPGAAQLQRAELRARYRAFLEQALPSHGSSYEEFAAYTKATGTGNPSPESKRALGTLIRGQCPERDKTRIENAAYGLMKLCEGRKG
ncbi:MAG: hypothetical protein RQ748_00185 [Elusimicrobiales bacterium]|nr:hypothetical protein [Elusimicrobiales bacterium]